MSQKPTLLLVDDVPSNIRALAAALSGEYRLRFATSGLEALTETAREKPDLILLDALMPEMDGYETCRRLKSNPATADIPVIFVTALSEDTYEEKGLDAGAIDYLTKNASRSIIRARIRNHLERHRVEKELAEHSAALERSNAELEQFAYGVSHDLRQPLRMVSSYLGLIEKRLPADDADLRDFLGFAISGAQRMDSMIVRLLDYAQAGQAEDQALVDLNDVLAEVRQTVAASCAAQGGSLTIADAFPVVRGDRLAFVRLFQNLISNALKFHRPDETPQVTVDWQEDGTNWRLAVRDSGIGIPAELQKDVFGVFRRLVRQKEYEGSGIGLAICKKIVDKAGGRIWVESASGQGCIFWISLPKQNLTP